VPGYYQPVPPGQKPSPIEVFKWRQFEPEVILRFSLSYRDVEELLAERGLSVDHVTVWRWVQRYGPELDRRLRKRVKATNDSWRVDETYVRMKGKWVYLYRAVDSTGATIDFLLSAKRDAAAAERFLTKALVVRTIPRRGSSTPTSTLLIRQPSLSSKPTVFWKRSVLIDRCSILITSWNRITGPSNAGCVQASIFAPSGELDARSPATKRFI
jgi:DDE domain